MPATTFSYPKAGLPPGTLVYVGDKSGQPTSVELSIWHAGKFEAMPLATIGDIKPAMSRKGIKWFNITGVSDAKAIGDIGMIFGLHPLELEDIMNTRSRPRIDFSKNKAFLVLKSLTFDEPHSKVRREHIAIVYSQDYVLTFQERMPNDFKPVRDLLAKEPARLKKKGADFLAYLILDAALDRYFTVLEKIGERINSLDNELADKPDTPTLHKIQSLKTELIRMRRFVWPLREMIGHLSRAERKFLSEDTVPYLRDAQDHVMEMLDIIEMYRDMLSTMVDVYLSTLSNKINQIMKVLTVISTIFMPLTFLVGLWGMNFRQIPLSEWEFGFEAIMVICIGAALLLLAYFKKNDWI